MRRSLLVRGAACLALVLSVTLWLDGGIAVHSASSGFPTGKVTITVFGSDEEPQFKLEEDLIGEWQKLHPNVTVQAQQAPLGPAFQKLSTQLPTGGGPTIFSVFEPWIEGFSPYMAPANPGAFGVGSMKQIYDLYLPHSLEAQSRNSQIYCLPSAAPSWSLLINKAKFTAAGLRIPEDVPHTWVQVAALQGKLTKYDSNNHLVQRGFGIRYTAGPQWYSMLFVASIESQGGTRSSLETPLWDAVEGFVSGFEPNARLAPISVAGFTDSHWLRETYGTVAYGFFPLQAMSAEVAARLIHSADERIAVEDLEFGVCFLRHVAQEIGG